MDRATAYPLEETTELDILNTNKFAMIALGKLAVAILGTGPYLHGLACTPGSGLTAQVAAGQIYQTAQIDATAYSTLGTDSHTLLKQGIALDPTVLACPAPTTAGQSINYLIQVGYQDVDTGNSVLPFYNASNPAIPYTGPGGSGGPVSTIRAGRCAVHVKAGVAAATGSQTTPPPDSGFTAAYVITIAYGATSVAGGNIALAANAPFVSGLMNSHHGGVAGQAPKIHLESEVQGILPNDNLPVTVRSGYYTDTGLANAYVVATSPATSSYTHGQTFSFKVANTNNSSCTLNAGAGAVPLLRDDAGAMANGDLPAGSLLEVSYDSAYAAFLAHGLVVSQLPVASGSVAGIALYQLGLTF